MAHAGLKGLRNKATKLVRPTYPASLKESFQHTRDLCFPQRCTFYDVKFMHSYCNKLLPNHFDDCFIPISSIHSYATRLSIFNNLFLPKVNSSSGKCSLTFVGLKVWSSIPNCVKSSATFAFRWKVRTPLIWKQYIIMCFNNISIITM